ncbi:hypothetical protein ACR6C2_04095 [Streptomyces sp. INA 01156]
MALSLRCPDPVGEGAEDAGQGVQLVVAGAQQLRQVLVQHLPQQAGGRLRHARPTVRSAQREHRQHSVREARRQCDASPPSPS